MAITLVTELPQGRSSSTEVRNNRVVYKYARVFHVYSDNEADTIVDVKLATGVPRVLQPHPDFNGAWAERVEANYVQNSYNPFLWVVAVDYSSLVDVNVSEDPLLQPPDYEFDQATRTINLQRDMDGVLIANKAGVPFVPGIPKEIHPPVLVVTRNEATLNPGRVMSFVDHVNAQSFFGAAAGQALMASIKYRTVRENGTAYWRVQYVIQFEQDTWQFWAQNAGYLEKRVVPSPGGGSETKLVTAVDSAGVPFPEPTLLDDDGFRLAQGGTVIYIPFRRYLSADFNALGLI